MKPYFLILLLAFRCAGQDLFSANLIPTPAASSSDYTAGLIAWFKGTSLSALNPGDKVNNWNDNSGNSANLTQTFLAARPYYTNNVASANNAAGVVFQTSISASMDWTNVNVAATNYYIIMAIDCKDGANSTEERIMGENSGRLILDTNDGSNKVGWYDGSFHTFNSSTSGLKIYEFVLDTTGNVKTNNVSLGTAGYTKVPIASANTLTIGSSGGTTTWNGTMYEFRIYGFIPTAGNQTIVYNAVRAYVGL